MDNWSENLLSKRKHRRYMEYQAKIIYELLILHLFIKLNIKRKLTGPKIVPCHLNTFIKKNIKNIKYMLNQFLNIGKRHTIVIYWTS